MNGLALQGGGAMGAAHVGVLRALIEGGLRPDALAGTSAGAIAAAAYAWRGDMKDLETMLSLAIQYGPKLLDLNVRGLVQLAVSWLTRRDPRFLGVFRGARLERVVAQLTQGATLGQARLALAIPAVDLLSGELFVYSAQAPRLLDAWQWQADATLSEAVRASCSIPLVFCPLNRPGAMLVDGGVLQNLPAAALRRIGARKVLGVRLHARGGAPETPSNIFDVARHTFSALGQQMERQQDRAADRLLEITLPEGSGVFSFENMERFAEIGYETTRRALPDLWQWWRQPLPTPFGAAQAMHPLTTRTL